MQINVSGRRIVLLGNLVKPQSEQPVCGQESE
jgi:hypothetical protein